MITLLLAVAIGIFFTLVAVDNSQLSTLNVFGIVFSLPLYLVAALSFLIGALVTSLSSIFDWTQTAFDLRKREKNLNSTVRINEALQTDIQKLQNENTKLKEELDHLKIEERDRKNTERKEYVKNFFHKLTHPNSTSHSHLA